MKNASDAVAAALGARAYYGQMQLRDARLCLNCNEVHDRQVCPLCGSESFAFISRWVPVPEGQSALQPRPANETTEAYRRLITGERQASGRSRWIRRGALGLAALGIAGLAWTRKRAANRDQ